jgi:protein-S-isoprenylcysteine O-methyltransferase Ste14
MENNKIKELTFWGASPIIFLLTILFAIPVVSINYIFRSNFKISFIPHHVLIILAIILLCAGIPFYVHTAKKLKNAYKEQKLITNGIFKLCRNPLFAEVIFLILPGIILFFNSWFLLTIPCFMYFMFKVFIKREEKLLEKKFGKEYIDYKKVTNAIFPKFWKFNGK